MTPACPCPMCKRAYRLGYAAALDAARDAVAALPPIDQRVDDNGLISLVYDKREALAAIDALRGGKDRNVEKPDNDALSESYDGDWNRDLCGGDDHAA